MENAKRFQHIKELCDQLSGAVDASFRVHELAEELSRAVQEFARSTPPERRSIPRVEDAVTKPPSPSEVDLLLGRSRER
jgi:hypothetical protein